MKSLKVNDKVMVIAGAHKGTEAKIIKINRANNTACLEGIGVRERNLKRTQYNPRGGKKTIHLGIDLSNLKLVEAAKFEAKKADKKADKKAEKEAKKEAKKAKKGAK